MKAKSFLKESLTKQKAYQVLPEPDLIKLNQNELPYPWPKAMRQALAKHLSSLELNRYPLTEAINLQKALAKKLKLKPEQILVATGSNMILQVLVLALKHKTPVMGVRPSFALYDLIPKTFAYPFVEVPLRQSDFSLDEEKFLKKVKEKKPGLIFLANPNAPTGGLYRQTFLKKLLKLAPGLVLLDEAYYEFSGVTWIKELKKHPNLLISRTFSKAYGLGGVRLGYLVGEASLMTEIKKAYVPFNVGVLSEQAGLFALKEEKFFKTKLKEILTQREKLYQEMKKIKSLEVFPSQANFILFRLKNPQACFEFLKRKGLLIRNVSSQAGLAGCLRVSVGRPKENQQFLNALNQFA
ncbi:MAG: histidinol-phosphate transaminase [Deltaproteobacteria bacterium]|nr:histidinol-phosphate transaminase [Deltaproteobacteria bacterium]